jgi:hypothetical protein
LIVIYIIYQLGQASGYLIVYPGRRCTIWGTACILARVRQVIQSSGQVRTISAGVHEPFFLGVESKMIVVLAEKPLPEKGGE